MAYLLSSDRPLNSYEEWQSHWLKYQDYLESVKHDLPIAAYNFASAVWQYDEIRLSESGHVVHEVEWSSGSRWLIECADVTYEWTQLETVTEAGT